jgi:hypothetical protein
VPRIIPPSRAHTHLTRALIACPSLLLQVRWFNYGVGEGAGGQLESHPGEVWYRLSLDPAEAWKKISLRRRATGGGSISDPAYGLYAAALPMKPDKVKDLAKFKKWLPAEFHPLYPDYKAHATAEEEAAEEEEVEDEDEDEDKDEDEEGTEDEQDKDQEPSRRARSGKDEQEDGGAEEDYEDELDAVE